MGNLNHGAVSQSLPWSVEIQIAADVDVNPADIPIYTANCPAKGIVAGVLFSPAGGSAQGSVGEVSDGPDSLSSVISSVAIPNQSVGVGSGKFADVGHTVVFKVTDRSKWEGSLVVTFVPVA